MTGWHHADVWEVIADVRGDAPALLHDGRSISWAQFDRRADAVAASLVAGGVAQGDRIAQYLFNCPEYLEVNFAAYKAGLTPVNTNYRYKAAELVYLWSNADAAAVVFHGSLAASIEPIRGDVPTVQRWLWVDDHHGECPDWAEPYDDIATDPGAPGRYRAPWGRSPDDLVMIYTGGTTGRPKGVMWRHDDMYRSFQSADPQTVDLDHVRRRTLAADPGPVGLPASPQMHSTGLMFSKNILCQGGTVVTLAATSFDAGSMLDAVAEAGVETMAIVGDAFGRPILEALDAEPGSRDLSRLTMIVSAGVMWSAETKLGLAAHLPQCTFADLLGSTEAHGLGASVSGGTRGHATARFRLGERAFVLTDDGRRAGPGESGLLAVRGPGPIGYFKDPDKTAATFREVDGQIVSVPGDWARVDDDGGITLLGRGSLCINTAGEKVFPEEVEEALETHRAVRDSLVVGVPDARFGQAVAAVVELCDGADVTSDQLVDHVKSQLAGYKAPRHIAIVAEVPRAPNGKGDYQRARELVAAQVDGVTT